MDFKKALAAAVKTGIMPFPALARINNEEPKNTHEAVKPTTLKGNKS